MKLNRAFIFMLMVLMPFSGRGTIWVVGNSSNNFSPATITITFGDTVNFVMSSGHDAREVSLTTWNANGTTALPGGFQTAFGGGMVLRSA